MKTKSKMSKWVAIPALALLAVAAAGVSSASAQTTTSTTGTTGTTRLEVSAQSRKHHVFADRPKPTEAQKAEMKQKHEAIDAAITSANYSAFVTAAAGGPLEGKITEAQFPKFVEAHKLMKAGDKDGAKTIMKELGIKAPRGFMHKVGTDPSADSRAK
ncbi:MAG: hypothetical protein RIQ72_132 [Candidatus Parcubacteria bacterium]|jgi:hypothetical protein